MRTEVGFLEGKHWRADRRKHPGREEGMKPWVAKLKEMVWRKWGIGQDKDPGDETGSMGWQQPRVREQSCWACLPDRKLCPLGDRLGSH